jgi:hypothetical protein
LSAGTKNSPKSNAAMTFLLFTLNFKKMVLLVKMPINFSLISHHFDVKFVCVAKSDHSYHKTIWWHYKARPLVHP